MVIRTLRAVDNVAMPLWEVQEFLDPQWDTTPGDKTYWLGTSVNTAGFLQFRDMKEAVSHFLKYHPETYRIDTSWNTNVFISSLIPDAIAELAVNALYKQEKR